MRALVVDDDPVVLQSCRRILEEAGWEVRAAPAGDEAFAVLETAAFDLLLADLMMPGYDGLRLIAAAHEGWPTLAVVAMSGLATAEAEAQARARGAAGFLGKPFGPEELVDAVVRARGATGGG